MALMIAIIWMVSLVAAFVVGAYAYKRKGAKALAAAKAELKDLKKKAEDLKGKIPKI